MNDIWVNSFNRTLVGNKHEWGSSANGRRPKLRQSYTGECGIYIKTGGRDE